MAASKEQMKDIYLRMRRIRNFESAASRLFAEARSTALLTCIWARRQ